VCYCAGVLHMLHVVCMAVCIMYMMDAGSRFLCVNSEQCYGLWGAEEKAPAEN
jgi:hypothetical protein